MAIAKDRSDQQPAPSTNRFRLRSKQRGGVAAATAAIISGGAAAGAIANGKKDKKDKDGYKVNRMIFILSADVLNFRLFAL